MCVGGGGGTGKCSPSAGIITIVSLGRKEGEKETERQEKVREEDCGLETGVPGIYFGYCFLSSNNKEKEETTLCVFEI